MIDQYIIDYLTACPWDLAKLRYFAGKASTFPLGAPNSGLWNYGLVEGGISSAEKPTALGLRAIEHFESLPPTPGDKGGAGCPVVVQAEPAPGVAGVVTPARASIDEGAVEP
jgi:hypothetical protein